MPSMKSENLTSKTIPGAVKIWVLSTRPQTLIASISPVMIGTAIAASTRSPISFWVFSLCLMFSLFLQIATNWANDYFDYINGADTQDRKGPRRAVQSGWILPRHMLMAALLALFLAALSSLPLIHRIGWSYLPWMLICLLLALLYTGGKKPLGYLGWGDFLVFIFYGPIATAMSAKAELLYFPKDIWIASLLPGSLSCAILCVNNLRDYIEDRRAKKMTLIARFGPKFGQTEYALCLGISFIALASVIYKTFPLALLCIFMLLPLVIRSLKIVFRQPEKLNIVLKLTAKLLAAATMLLCIIMYAHILL